MGSIQHTQLQPPWDTHLGITLALGTHLALVRTQSRAASVSWKSLGVGTGRQDAGLEVPLTAVGPWRSHSPLLGLSYSSAKGQESLKPGGKANVV